MATSAVLPREADSGGFIISPRIVAWGRRGSSQNGRVSGVVRRSPFRPTRKFGGSRRSPGRVTAAAGVAAQGGCCAHRRVPSGRRIAWPQQASLPGELDLDRRRGATKPHQRDIRKEVVGSARSTLSRTRVAMNVERIRCSYASHSAKSSTSRCQSISTQS
jgi:hypothetical protein